MYQNDKFHGIHELGPLGAQVPLTGSPLPVSGCVCCLGEDRQLMEEPHAPRAPSYLPPNEESSEQVTGWRLNVKGQMMGHSQARPYNTHSIAEAVSGQF